MGELLGTLIGTILAIALICYFLKKKGLLKNE